MTTMTSALAGACAMQLRHCLEGAPPQTIFLERGGMSVFSEQTASGALLSCASITVTGAIFKQPACEKAFFSSLFSFSFFFWVKLGASSLWRLLVYHTLFDPGPEPLCICICI